MNALARILAWTIALVLVVLPVVAVLNGWLAADRWPIERLQVTAEFQRVSAEQVSHAIAPQLSAGFFALDIEGISEAVAALPWVAEVEVRKRWPNALEVRLVEHRARARWGEVRLVSEQGELFVAPGGDVLQGLPQLEGPDDRVAEVLAFHAFAMQSLSGSGLSVRRLRLSLRGSWSLDLADGARVLLGRSDAAIRLDRLANHLPALLAADGRALERADFRYANGFAVRWRAEESDTPRKES